MTVDPSGERPGWQPQDEHDIQRVINDGLLRETHYLDVKRELGSSDGERKNIARHLASLAIDGGALLLGVEERKEERSWRLAPQPLDGLAERIEQIGTHLVDPPLYLRCLDIISGPEPSTGYLFVEVPPSSQAPHMVDGAYYGRGDRTRTRLSDAEVVRYHARRESLDALTERLLDEEAARDPQPQPHLRKCGRLYGVAQPLTAPRQVAQALTTGPEQGLRSLLQDVEDSIPDLMQGEPSPRMLSHFSRRAQGVALSDYTLSGPGRTLVSIREGADPDEERMLDVEFRQDGGVRLLAGRLTSIVGTRAHDDPTPYFAILEVHAVAYSFRLVHWALAVSERTGYRGAWAFGIHGTGMRALLSYVHVQERGFGAVNGHPFDAETYRETTTATHVEMLERPHAVAERLVGRLTRALGTAHRWPQLTAP